MPRAITDQEDFLNAIEKSFLNSQHQWFDEPVLNKWDKDPAVHHVLHHINDLYHEWRDSPLGPFSPFSDPLWLETANVLRDAGLPWHNNNLNLPEDIDMSWPFHFKDFERHVVLTKGARVDDNDASGYICNWTETNLYAIRALQQELRRQMPDAQPLLVTCCLESSIAQSASQLFGLELLQLHYSWKDARETLIEHTDGRRPIIAATTLGNDRGQMDDFNAIRQLSEELPIFLHVDASRTFDYLTTMSRSERERLGLPRLVLRHPFEPQPPARPSEHIIIAATIVAAGTNSISPPPTVILKPRSLGTPSDVKVEYVRGTDSTLAGSRDALGPLLMCLQELRFGSSGMREIYARCHSNRAALQEALESHGVTVEVPPGSLDLVLNDVHLPQSSLKNLGLQALTNNNYLLTLQPSVTKQDAMDLTRQLVRTKALSPSLSSWIHTQSAEYPVPEDITQTIRSVVDHFRVVGQDSGGYPLNQAPYTALGPIIGHFLPLTIPPAWAAARASEILRARKSSFGLPQNDHVAFPACFTTGSTMGNRVGVHTALAQHPDAYVYYSSATHYSVKKIVRDSDTLTGLWRPDKRPRFAEIPVDEYGRMQIPLLVEQVRRDQVHCAASNEQHRIFLFANIGTTFLGGRDEILGMRAALDAVDAQLAYIHVDGALDLGFAPDSVRLGPPSQTDRDGLPVVQGLTLSHHKAFGIMVSGEVICYNPSTGRIPTASAVDPRIIFETYLFQQLYSPADLLATRQYCFDNATHLRRSLESIGIATHYNKDSMITLLERLPPWLVQDFHLAPEGEWVHYITMPHITHRAIQHFFASILRVDMHFAAAFRALRAPLAAFLGQSVQLRRVRVHDRAVFAQIAGMARRELGQRGEGFDVEACKRRYVYGAMSYAAVSAAGEPLAVFLTEANAERLLTPGPVLMAPAVRCDERALQEMGMHGFEYLARRMGLRVAQNRLLPPKNRWQVRRCSEPVQERPRLYVEA